MMGHNVVRIRDWTQNQVFWLNKMCSLSLSTIFPQWLCFRLSNKHSDVLERVGGSVSPWNRSVSCGCCNHLPKAWWLKTREVYSLTIWYHGDLFRVSAHVCREVPAPTPQVGQKWAGVGGIRAQTPSGMPQGGLCRFPCLTVLSKELLTSK